MRLPFFRSRPSSATAHQVVRGSPSAPVKPPPTQPHDLIDVIGVGVTENVGGVALTLLSVERYREGHIALFRLLRARGLFEMEYPSPRLHLAVTPEGTVPYRFWMMGVGGGDVLGEIAYRLSYVIVPAPPSDVSTTVIEVREIVWERWKDGTHKVASVDPGPWRFTINH